MHLNAQQFADIVSSLDKSLIDRKRDQRRSNRAVQRRPIKIFPVKDGVHGSPLDVTLHDFSTRGIGILFKEPLGRGEQFITRMIRADHPPIEILCTVAHSKPIGQELWKIGAEFTCIINAATKPQTASNEEAARIQKSMLG